MDLVSVTDDGRRRQTRQIHADAHAGELWKLLPLVQTAKSRVAGSFRVFVVRDSERDATVRSLKNSTNSKTRALVHVPSGGGEGADDDGEPAAAGVGELLAALAPPGNAVVVWRCFGGEDPPADQLRAEYHECASAAVASHAASAAIAQEKKGQPAGDGIRVLARMSLDLDIPCVCYDPAFLPTDEADRLFELLSPLVGGEVQWSTSARVNHATAIYGGVRGYSTETGAGYASKTVNPWCSELLAVRDRAERWHAAHTGRRVDFNVCLLNRYDGGGESLGWHADREEMDPAVDGPRASPIASVSLGTTRKFGLRRHGASKVDVLQLEHGSLCLMENACQFLYKHSLMPEAGLDGIRVNLTFRSKLPVRSARGWPPPAAEPEPLLSEEGDGVPTAPEARSEATSVGIDARGTASEGFGTKFVGLTAGVDHQPAGWKGKLFHPFESPFINDAPRVAAARYRTWLEAQPIFGGWVVQQLAAEKLYPVGQDCAEHDRVHAQALSKLVGAAAGNAEASKQGRLSVYSGVAVLENNPSEDATVSTGDVRIGNLKQIGGAGLTMNERRAKLMQQQQPRCRDFAKGRCQRGENCRYSHSDDSVLAGFTTICVDRSSVLGNPFKMGTSGRDEKLRDRACDAFADLLSAPAGACLRTIASRHNVTIDSRFITSPPRSTDLNDPGNSKAEETVDSAGIAGDERALACDASRKKSLAELCERLRHGESLRLMCWCVPRRCHAEEIAKWLLARAMQPEAYPEP